MKKIILSLSLLATSAVLFTACNNKEKEDDIIAPVEETPTLIKNWNVDSMAIKVGAMGMTIIDSMQYFTPGQYTMNFISETQVVVNMDGDIDTSNYTVSGNVISVDSTDFQYQLTTNNLSLSADQDIVDSASNMTYNMKMNIFATKK